MMVWWWHSDGINGIYCYNYAFWYDENSTKSGSPWGEVHLGASAAPKLGPGGIFVGSWEMDGMNDDWLVIVFFLKFDPSIFRVWHGLAMKVWRTIKQTSKPTGVSFMFATKGMCTTQLFSCRVSLNMVTHHPSYGNLIGTCWYLVLSEWDF